ncbi:MAG TPA: polysaccharide deacetylase family protein [Burkholderiales bacterium]
MSDDADWQAFGAELARWQAAGRVVEFWWRDDDATAPTDALDRLTALGARHGIPLTLAVIPQASVAALFEATEGIDFIQHGSDHRNRAGAGAKKTEFPAQEDPAAALGRLRDARLRLEALSSGRALPVLAPPWNRLHPGLATRLAEAGLRGLSRFQARGPEGIPGLTQVNTHIDLIAWRGDRGFAGSAQVLAQACAHLEARRLGTASPDEPTGWLSHHAVHDAATWDFLEALFARTAGRDGVRWRRAADLFPPAPGP